MAIGIADGFDGGGEEARRQDLVSPMAITEGHTPTSSSAMKGLAATPSPAKRKESMAVASPTATLEGGTGGENDLVCRGLSFPSSKKAKRPSSPCPSKNPIYWCCLDDTTYEQAKDSSSQDTELTSALGSSETLAVVKSNEQKYVSTTSRYFNITRNAVLSPQSQCNNTSQESEAPPSISWQPLARWKYHNIFLCLFEAESVKNLSLYVNEEADGFTEARFVPGGTELKLFSTEQADGIIGGIIGALRKSHNKSCCFCGKFSLYDFCRTEDGVVKMLPIDENYILPLSPEGCDMDYVQAAHMIENDIFWFELAVGTELPASIRELLEVLRNNPSRDEELICSVIALLRCVERIARFNLMYANYKLLRKRDPVSYRRIHNFVTQHECSEEWKVKARGNYFLEMVLDHLNPDTGLPTEYKEDGKGLLHFIHNVIQHVMKYSIKPLTFEQLFTYEEMDVIISGTFEGLFEVFQRAMFEEGQVF